MTTAAAQPRTARDPEPDDEDQGPWCRAWRNR